MCAMRGAVSRRATGGETKNGVEGRILCVVMRGREDSDMQASKRAWNFGREAERVRTLRYIGA